MSRGRKRWLDSAILFGVLRPLDGLAARLMQISEQSKSTN